MPQLRVLSVGLMLPLIVWPSISAAQDVGRRRPALIEEVIVTAQKREESIYDVPIAMQAFTGEALRQRGIVDTSDLANVIPGFSYSTQGFDTPIFTMRGIGFNDASRTANSALGVYVDEVPLAYPYMTQGADVDLERIEVLKGPQGTLYGRNTTGGAINYIAEKPTDSLEFGGTAEYGRFETYSLEGYISGPFTERLGGRIAVRQIKADEGWQKSLTRPSDRLGKKDKQGARATLEWDPTNTFRLNFTVDWWRDRSEPQAPQAVAIVAQNTALSKDQIHPDVRNHPVVESENARLADWVPGIPWTLDNDFLMPALRAYWDITDRASLTLIAAYSEFKTGHARIPFSGLSVANNELSRQSTDTTAHSIELRGTGHHFEDRLSWLFGLFTSKDNVEAIEQAFIETNSAVFNVVPGVTPIADHTLILARQSADSDAVFANAEYGLTSYLQLAIGARYTEEVRKYSGCAIDDPEDEGQLGLTPIFNARSISEGGSGGAQTGDCLTLDESTRNPSLIRKELKEDNLGGKASITWTHTEDHLFYISYSRGFKSGSFPIIPATSGEAYDPVTQERVDSVEVGGKTSWFDELLRINFAAFDYDYKDKQQFSFFIDPVFGPLPKLFNVPESKVQGGELEIQYSPLAGLYISGAASYLDTEIREFVGINGEGETVDFSGRQLPFSPKKEVTVVVDYRFPLPIFNGFEGMVGLDYSYVGEATSRMEDERRFVISSYELVNVRTGIGDLENHWDAIVWIRNAGNEFYQISQPAFPADTVVRYTGMPRTAGVTFSYRFY